MELSDKDIQLIENALLDRLSDEDQLLLNTRMKDDAFAAEYERHKQMVELLNQEGRSEFKDGLQQLDAEMPQIAYKKGRTIPMYVRWLAAASIIALISYIGFQWTNSTNHNDIFNDYYEAYPNLIDPVTKGNESGTMSPFQLFESGRYKAARSALAALEEGEESDFYFALTYFHTDDIETAIIKLSEIANSDTHRFKTEAKWYLGLAHIRANNTDAATTILKDLSKDQDQRFRDRAAQVLIDLE